MSPKTRAALVGAIRRIWSRHPDKLAAMKAVEIREYPTNADGERAKRPLVFYKCQLCGTRAKANASNHYPRIHLDHVEPVVPVDGRPLSWDELIARMFTTPDNLMPLCEPCHRVKTLAENALRRENKKKLNQLPMAG